MNFNVIFPMAGESKRFNYQFKPFLQISDLTFISPPFVLTVMIFQDPNYLIKGIDTL